MQDRPSSPELVAAVTAFLERELIPTLTDSRLRFRALVAANLLNIVSREMELDEAQLQAEWERFKTLSPPLPLGEGLGQRSDSPLPLGEGLGQRSDSPLLLGEGTGVRDVRAQVQTMTRELCSLIRAGQADEGEFHNAVVAHVEQTVIEKLQIANPRFLQRVIRE